MSLPHTKTQRHWVPFLNSELLNSELQFDAFSYSGIKLYVLVPGQPGVVQAVLGKGLLGETAQVTVSVKPS